MSLVRERTRQAGREWKGNKKEWWVQRWYCCSCWLW